MNPDTSTESPQIPFQEKWNVREEIRMSDRVLYHDNTRISRLKWGSEYLAITFQTPDTKWSPQSVTLYRYCVPGRCDTYWFDWVAPETGIGNRLRYFSEANTAITRSLAMVAKDLDQPQVVELVKRACNAGFQQHARQFTEHLLASVAPRSKSLRMARREIAKAIARKAASVRARKEKV